MINCFSLHNVFQVRKLRSAYLFLYLQITIISTDSSLMILNRAAPSVQHFSTSLKFSGSRMETAYQSEETAIIYERNDKDSENGIPGTLPTTVTRRKIHMDSLACHILANSSEGSKSICNPSVGSCSGDANKGLYPVTRHRKRKRNDDDRDFEQKNIGGLALSQGFVSASDMYSLVKDKNMQHVVSNQEKQSPVKRTKSKIKQIPNQGSILPFLSRQSSAIKELLPDNDSKPDSASLSEAFVEKKYKKESSSSPVNDCENSESKQQRCFMYSPIKKLSKDSSSSSCIYISDNSPSCSPSSSQDSQGPQPISQGEKLADNAVVKKLFEAQKTEDLTLKPGKKKPKPSPFVQKKEVENIKSEAAKYFVGDSLDMERNFISDHKDDTSLSRPHTNSVLYQHPTGDKYGLLGSGSYPREDSEKVNYFDLLPPEILDNIFCQLPMLDLCLNCNRVCRKWNNIIADEKVL